MIWSKVLHGRFFLMKEGQWQWLPDGFHWWSKRDGFCPELHLVGSETCWTQEKSATMLADACPKRHSAVPLSEFAVDTLKLPLEADRWTPIVQGYSWTLLDYCGKAYGWQPPSLLGERIIFTKSESEKRFQEVLQWDRKGGYLGKGPKLWLRFFENRLGCDNHLRWFPHWCHK